VIKNITFTLIAGLLIGCTGNTNEQISVEVENNSVCPDDGPVLPKTGICVGRAVNYLNIVDGEAPSIPDNCRWSVNETAFPAGEFLLYRAVECKGKTAKLGFSGGAQFASLNLEWSAIAGAPNEGTQLVLITSADKNAPHANILLQAQNDLGNDAQSKTCRVRSANRAYWPSDALVVDTLDVEGAMNARSDEPRAACGRFGLDEENTSYWRVFQEFSWWFQLSQDQYQDIDPASLTIVTPDENGGWATVE